MVAPIAPVRSRGRCRRTTGFTLIEVMIVVAVLGILAAMALPMLGATETSQLKAAAQLLAADLAYAQIESIAHSDDLRLVVFDQDADAYWIAAQSAQTTPITNPVGKLPYRVQFGQGAAAHLAGVTIQSLAVGGDDRVRFGMYGQLDQTTAATITLAAGGKAITITLDPATGEASIGELH